MFCVFRSPQFAPSLMVAIAQAVPEVCRLSCSGHAGSVPVVPPARRIHLLFFSPAAPDPFAALVVVS